jgi:hypothetical protein
MYYSITYLHNVSGITRTKTMPNSDRLISWAKDNIPNFTTDMVHMSIDPTKHTHYEEYDLTYWVEPVQWRQFDEEPNSWMVVFQKNGYPSTEALDDWFGSYEDADEIAYLMSCGKEY